MMTDVSAASTVVTTRLLLLSVIVLLVGRNWAFTTTIQQPFFRSIRYTTEHPTSIRDGSISGTPEGDEGEDTTERDYLGMLRPKTKWSGGTYVPMSSLEDVFSEGGVEENGKIPVRFINYDTIGTGEQGKLVYALQGTNILKIADEANVYIPRQCRSGLCGSCTADVKDPTWIGGENDRMGFQTIRTCQAGAMLPAGCDEMIIDCYRSAQSGVSTSPSGSMQEKAIPEMGGEAFGNPSKNFDQGWEKSFAPDYKSGGQIKVLKKATPEYTVKQGQRSTMEIDEPSWTPRVDCNIAPWETIW